MLYDANQLFQSAAGVAARGMKVVKLYGLRDDLSCTCHRGAECTVAGKHPVGESWHLHATDDEETISSWFRETSDNVRWNIGVRLGRTSGIIDVEADDANAIAVMKRYGLDEIDTVAYVGSRGPHYLFQHDSELPDSGVVKVDGLEVRIGGGEKATQSVFPSSWHSSGKQYQWLPGRSPDEVDIAVLPEEFRAAVISSSKVSRGGGLIAQSRQTLAAGIKIEMGGRHPWLVGIASKYAQRIPHYTDAERAELLSVMRALNADRCQPPKSDDEVRKIADDQFDFYSGRAAERGVRPLERAGLRWNVTTREWEPGDWSLTVVHSVPPEYRISMPSPSTEGKRATCTVQAVDWQVPKYVAAAILTETLILNVCDPTPARWAAIWNGEVREDEDGNTRTTQGLNFKLLESAQHEYPSVEHNAFATRVSVLLSFLNKCDKTESTDDEPTPNNNGLPKWLKKAGRWRLVFKWHDTVNAAYRAKNLPPPTQQESRSIKAFIDAAFPDDAALRSGELLDASGGKQPRTRFLCWYTDQIELLSKITGA